MDAVMRRPFLLPVFALSFCAAIACSSPSSESGVLDFGGGAATGGDIGGGDSTAGGSIGGGDIGGETSGGGTVSGGTVVGGNTCSFCANPSCGNGLISTAPISSPGCVEMCQSQFCPGGCTPDGTTCVAFALSDGGVGTCSASQLIVTSGQLPSTEDGGGVAVAQGSTVVLASSAELACVINFDAGFLPPSPAVVLSLNIANFTSTVGNTAVLGPGGATLTTWVDGGRVTTSATLGSLTLTLQQPGGGVMADYTLQFGSDIETGSFIAPDCDVCTTPPP
jgi:hypothetical protein